MSWLLLPFVAAAIGWFTNFIAVRMIFRPRTPVGFGGLKIQGLLPKRRKEFAQNIGATVADHLIRPEDLAVVLDHPDTRRELEDVIAAKIDVFFDKKLAQEVPMLAGFLKGSLVDSIKATLKKEMSGVVESVASSLGDGLGDRLDLKGMVERKILDFDFDQLEAIVLRVASRELRWIEILGAVLGFIIGFAQLGILKLTGAM